MVQAHIFISGFVQGVGFRAFIRNQAKKLQITGWIKNLPDGRVEAVFQGTSEKIKKLISICRNGPFLSEVKDIVIEWEEITETDQEFSIQT